MVSGQVPLGCLAAPIPAYDRVNLLLGVTTPPRRRRNRVAHVGDFTPPNVRPSDAVAVTDTVNGQDPIDLPRGAATPGRRHHAR